MDALMSISFRTESEATEGTTAEQNIQRFLSDECRYIGVSELETKSVLAGPLLTAVRRSSEVISPPGNQNEPATANFINQAKNHDDARVSCEPGMREDNS